MSDLTTPTGTHRVTPTSLVTAKRGPIAVLRLFTLGEAQYN
jgi:hypothetical protein